MADELKLFSKILLVFFILELGIALISYVSVTNIPNSPSLAKLNSLSTSFNQSTTTMLAPINCGFNFTGSCVLITVTNQSNGVLDINWFLNAIVEFVDVIAELVTFIIGFILLIGLGIYAVLFLSFGFIPTIIGNANIGGLGFIFSLAFPLAVIMIAIYALYIIRNILGSIIGVVR